MPAMPSTLPRRAVVGCDKPFSARMKQIDAIRYHSATWSALIVPPRLRTATLRVPHRRPAVRAPGAAWRRSYASLLHRRHDLRLFPLEHLEHSLRDEEAAECVDRRHHHGRNADPAAPIE